VVVHRNVQQATCRNELFRYDAIVRRRRWIAARMIVHEYDRGRPLGDCLAKYLAWMDERRIEYTPGDHDVSFQSMLRIQYRYVKLLNRKIFQAGGE
jgi:hypothetical protein